MNENFETLDRMIQIISQNTKAHICIHDISGILKIRALQLKFDNQIHSKPFCSAVKSMPKGYKLCINCKMCANAKAINEKTIFTGYCFSGLFEIVKPVVIDGVVQCIIYIGNLILEKEETLKRIRKVCKSINLNEAELINQLSQVQRIESEDSYISMANLIDSYIRLLYKNIKFRKEKEDNEYHWAVITLKSYVDTNFEKNISLSNISRLYFINDKYLGRMFKKQLGYTYHEYLMAVRLDNAVELLQNTQKKIVEIALDCGFQNITYFNRAFSKKYKMTPTKFRSGKG